MGTDNDAMDLLVFPVPGLVALRVISDKRDVKKQEHEYYFIWSIFCSVIVYMVAGLLNLNADLRSNPSLEGWRCGNPRMTLHA